MRRHESYVYLLHCRTCEKNWSSENRTEPCLQCDLPGQVIYVADENDPDDLIAV